MTFQQRVERILDKKLADVLHDSGVQESPRGRRPIIVQAQRPSLDASDLLMLLQEGGSSLRQSLKEVLYPEVGTFPLPGKRGEKGDKGDPGEQGPAGEAGKRGIPGAPGQDAECSTRPVQTVQVVVLPRHGPVVCLDTPMTVTTPDGRFEILVPCHAEAIVEYAGDDYYWQANYTNDACDATANFSDSDPDDPYMYDIDIGSPTAGKPNGYSGDNLTMVTWDAIMRPIIMPLNATQDTAETYSVWTMFTGIYKVVYHHEYLDLRNGRHLVVDTPIRVRLLGIRQLFPRCVRVQPLNSDCCGFAASSSGQPIPIQPIKPPYFDKGEVWFPPEPSRFYEDDELVKANGISWFDLEPGLPLPLVPEDPWDEDGEITDGAPTKYPYGSTPVDGRFPGKLANTPDWTYTFYAAFPDNPSDPLRTDEGYIGETAGGATLNIAGAKWSNNAREWAANHPDRTYIETPVEVVGDDDEVHRFLEITVGGTSSQAGPDFVRLEQESPGYVYSAMHEDAW